MLFALLLMICYESRWRRTCRGTRAVPHTLAPTFARSYDGCAEHDLDPLGLRRSDVELFVRWLEEVRRVKPATVSRRLSVVTCFYRTCVIDAVLESSPAAYVRRPTVPAESPTLGLSHLRFEAMIVAARTSTNPLDRALVSMLGLLGCASSRPAAPPSTTSGKN